MDKLLLQTFILFLFSSTKNVVYAAESDANFDDITIQLDKDVRFFLYTQKNGQNSEQLWLNDTQSILFSTYNFEHPTKFVTHGWLSSKDGESCTFIRDAFLSHDYHNVIVIDWSNITKRSLKEIVAHIPRVGSHIAKMINFLVSHGSNHNNISLVGHSMGSLLMGSVGNQSSYKVGHLVGLDPASPSRLADLDKTISPAEVRSISKSDAKLVEIIYTLQGNSELLKGQVGHAEFYPNGGGPKQPGCNVNIGNPDECSHNRAYFLYAEAIRRPEEFIAKKCSDYKTFTTGHCGNHTIVQFPNWSSENKDHGLFFLRTAGSSPFGLSLDGIKPNIGL